MTGGLSSCLQCVGPEHVFDVAVEAFEQTIGLWVVGCCLGMLDVEQVAQGGPQGGGELGAVVRVMTALDQLWCNGP